MERTLFLIKGYKIDYQKLQETFSSMNVERVPLMEELRPVAGFHGFVFADGDDIDELKTYLCPSEVIFMISWRRHSRLKTVRLTCHTDSPNYILLNISIPRFPALGDRSG